jgi:ApaG protein
MNSDGFNMNGNAQINDNGLVNIKVRTRYLQGESQPEQQRYVFAYTITITNNGPEPVKLLNRYWRIIDANDKIQEVRGEGVVGQQPHLKTGESFQYTSGAMIGTKFGTMEGNYEMVTDDGDTFEAPIPTFVLAEPNALH